MGIIRNPRLFSTHFGINEDEIKKYGALNPMLNNDTKLFIDPTLLSESKHKIINTNAQKTLDIFFRTIVKLLKGSKEKYDLAWNQAEKRLVFHEMKENCLGYGDGTISGNAFGPILRENLIETAKYIVDLGVEDLDFFIQIADN